MRAGGCARAPGVAFERAPKKAAVVTGGCSGPGLATTRALAGAGASVVVPARRPAAAEEVRAGVGGVGSTSSTSPTCCSPCSSTRSAGGPGSGRSPSIRARSSPNSCAVRPRSGWSTGDGSTSRAHRSPRASRRRNARRPGCGRPRRPARRTGAVSIPRTATWPRRSVRTRRANRPAGTVLCDRPRRRGAAVGAVGGTHGTGRPRPRPPTPAPPPCRGRVARPARRRTGGPPPGRWIRPYRLAGGGADFSSTSTSVGTWLSPTLFTEVTRVTGPPRRSSRNCSRSFAAGPSSSSLR